MAEDVSFQNPRSGTSGLKLLSFSPAHILNSSARVVMISDTHGKHKYLTDMPDGDILIHAGDCCGKETTQRDPSLRLATTALIEFLSWFQRFPHPIKILIAGNHDFPFTGVDFCTGKPFIKSKENVRQFCSNAGVIYLEDQDYMVDRLRIYGTPWQPQFKDMAFNADQQRRTEIFEAIPEDLDILVTHIPPYGTLDLNAAGQHCGCNILSANLPRINPRLHAFGHIHEASGKVQDSGRISVNASSVDQNWLLKNKPICVDLKV